MVKELQTRTAASAVVDRDQAALAAPKPAPGRSKYPKN